MMMQLPGFARAVAQTQDPLERLFAIYEAHWPDINSRRWCQRQVREGKSQIPKSRMEAIKAEVEQLEKKQIVLMGMEPRTEAIQDRVFRELDFAILRYIFLKDVLNERAGV